MEYREDYVAKGNSNVKLSVKTPRRPSRFGDGSCMRS